MTKNELIKAYFEWMYWLVCDDKRYYKKPSYRRLLRYLHSIDFDYILPMDGNRAEDGTDLRYRFAYENGYDDRMVAAYLDDRPCSVLEMMIALIIRCEEHIMEDHDIGDRKGQWFWNMIVSLGLNTQNDDNFDDEYVDEVIDIFLHRDYQPNGKGGLFTVENYRRDMRTVDIWYQMNWYLNEIDDI